MILISPRYEEVHEHYDGTCIESHRRDINGTTYLFTRVGSNARTIVTATKFDVIGMRSHLISGSTNATRK